MPKEIDVIIVTHKRRRQLISCVEKLRSFSKCSIIVVVDGHDAETVEYLEKCSKDNCDIRYEVLHESVRKSKARNRGIELASSDILYFIDDDAYCGDKALDIVLERFKNDPALSVVGGPNLTPGPGTLFQRVTGYLFSSPLIAWKMSRRYKATEDETPCDDASLILCNLAIRKRVFDKEGLRFNEQLDYNEENLLLSQLKAKGYRMAYCSDMVVYHERRPGVMQYAMQIFGSGTGRAMMTKHYPFSIRPYHLMPAVFLIYLSALTVYYPWWFSLPLGLYAVLMAANAVYLSIKHKENIAGAVWMFILPFVAHMSYGTGFIIGMFKLLSWKK